MIAQAPTQHAVLISSGPRPSAKRWARFVRPDQLHHRAQVRRIVKESNGAASVVLAPDNGIPEGVRAGQFLTLVAQIDGKPVKRAYSLSELPKDGTLTITSKRVEGGVMSAYLNARLREGDWLQFAGPSGDFVLPAQAPGHYVFAAAGSGITPMMAMLDQLLGQEHRTTPITLFYGNRREQDILFRERLDALARRNKNLDVRYVLSKPEKGALAAPHCGMPRRVLRCTTSSAVRIISTTRCAANSSRSGFRHRPSPASVSRPSRVNRARIPRTRIRCCSGWGGQRKR